MTYSQLLQREEWQNKRKEILERDRYRCTATGCHMKEKVNDKYQVSSVIIFDEFLKGKGVIDFRIDNTNKVMLLKTANNEIEINLLVHIPENANHEKIRIYLVKIPVGMFMSMKYFADYNFQSSLAKMNVHHKKYIQGHKPWEYNSEDLVTLCEGCHKSVHATTIIPIYSKSGINIDSAQICTRCGGAGYLPVYSYHMDGICFECYGEGVVISNL